MTMNIIINTVYEYHDISKTYPMMSEKEHNNLVADMEENGFDQNFPITIYEGKILDGRNRYKAAKEANVEPQFQEFEGTLEEAHNKSKQLNTNRRHLTPTQKAMIAAKEVITSREGSGKKTPISVAAARHAVGETYVKKAIKIAETDMLIAEQVFNGTTHIKDAEYKIDEIERLRQPRQELPSYEKPSKENTQEQSIIEEFANNQEETAKRFVSLQDQYKETVKKLKECEERCRKQKT